MTYIEDLKEMLCEELDKIASKGELTAGSLDTVDKLSHSLKSVLTIMAMEGYGDDWSYEDGSYERGGNRGGGRSNRRGRDSMGRYTSRSYARNGRSRRMYSGDDMEQKITELMNEVDDPKVRQALQKALDKMEE